MSKNEYQERADQVWAWLNQWMSSVFAAVSLGTLSVNGVGRLVQRQVVFASLALEQNPPEMPERFVPIHPSGMDVDFPVARSPSEESELLAVMRDVADRWKRLQGDAVVCTRHGLALLDAMASGVGLAFEDESESIVSLPQYLRTQVALQWAQEDGNVQLVYGDLSGIQKYIFRTAYSGKGVAKKLRARSFQILLLTRLVARFLCQETKGSDLQILMSAGGVFYVLLSPSVTIETLRNPIDTYLFSEFAGELALYTGTVIDTTIEMERSFSRLAQEAIQRAREEKEHPYMQQLQSHGHWEKDRMIRTQTGTTPRCAHCQRNPIREAERHVSEEERLCETCRALEELGKRLPHIHWISFSREPKGDFQFGVLGSVSLHETRPSVMEEDWFAINRPPDCLETDTIFWMNHYVPTYQRKPLSFSDIAGKEPLGYFKADVDHMGLMFAFGFSDDNRSTTSLQEYLALSETLDRFFTHHLQVLLEKEFPMVYSVFSGGDDVYLVGQASEVIQLATRLHDDFLRYTGSHPELSLSAGVAFVKPKQPLFKVTHDVESYLELAKEQPASSRRTRQMGGRNQVSVRGIPLEWDEWKRLLDMAQQVVNFLAEGTLSSNMWYRIMELVHSVVRRGNGTVSLQDGRTYEIFPKLDYEWRRNATESRHQPMVEWFRTLLALPDSDAVWIMENWKVLELFVKLISVRRLTQRQERGTFHG
ncbi:type III-A CRISPR-associated protein Cas10/Csm1 [Sulfoacidibacillus thermotolerans]|uniref:CRISPR system single-strand-specific deoxyribonuclease Cas10/Csm1 (subtype III-A) n=1 Tax=Sulfoacidibacillus thermotolerans TaxID=1765684 RepID=A0A2U3D8H5_SULT2|nr:type III-A CRISPR-associated protein Cas10/Csm1 [Sulfoacidibacillus thermotolerans]PWI57571.1 type III-A CRISPR-associated protein Cas10/Csm1 [Sulfoacidibacillus thermotolerans]